MEYYHWIILLVCLFIYHMYLLSEFDSLREMVKALKENVYESIRNINNRIPDINIVSQEHSRLISYLEHRDMAAALILEYNQKQMELHKYSGKHYYFDRTTANVLCTISFEEDRQESYTVREFENQILNPLRLAHAKSQLEKCKANCPDWQLEPIPEIGCLDSYVNHTTVPSRKKPRKSKRK